MNTRSDSTAHTSPQTEAAIAWRRTFYFVGLYIFILLILLTGLHYTAGTTAMDAYLFQISRQTHAVLSILGQESQLENPDQFRGHEADIRSKLGNEPNDKQDTPLQPIECWNFRRQQLRGNILLESQKDIPAPQRLQQLRKTLKGSGPVVFCGAADSPKTFQFQVVPECSGLSAMCIYAVAVIVFPVAWRKRLLGLVAGLLLLHGINVLRLAFLALLGVSTRGGAWFVFMHHYGWEVINIFLIIFLWLAWMELIVRPKRTKAGEAP